MRLCIVFALLFVCACPKKDSTPVSQPTATTPEPAAPAEPSSSPVVPQNLR